MIKISEELNNLLQKNSILRWGLSNKLFNLSQLARFLSPLIKARTKKDLKTSAILMSLSRFQKNISKIASYKPQYAIQSLTLLGNLKIATYNNDEKIHDKVDKFFKIAKSLNKYITITDGYKETTIIYDKELDPQLKKNIPHTPKKTFINISAIVINFPQKYAEISGLLHFLIQQISMQNINIVEISSTYTELIFYVDKKDVKLALDTFANLE